MKLLKYILPLLILFLIGCTTGQVVKQSICDYNAYNCVDFKTHAKAQAVYEECGGVANDIHWLDGDKDGLACETLP